MIRRILKIVIEAILLALLALVVRAQDGLHQSYNVSEKGSLSISNPRGTIHITGWDEKRVQVDAVKRGDRNNFDKVEVRVQEKPERLELETSTSAKGWRQNLDVTVDYDIKVPRSMILDNLVTNSGTILIEGAGSRISARSTSGHIRVIAAQGESRLSTASGNIIVEKAGDGVTARSASGKVTITGAKGNVVAESRGEDVTVSDVGGDATVLTDSGSVRVDGVAGRLQARAISGGLVARRIGGDVRLEGLSDSIVGTEIKGKVTASAISGGITLTGVMGGVRATTVSGTILIENASGPIEAQSTTSEIILRNIDSHEVKAMSHNSSVNYDGAIFDDGRYSFDSFSGSINLILPRASNFSFVGRTMNGQINSEFGLKSTQREAARAGQILVSGTYGSESGAQITAYSISGSIRLRRK